MSAYTRDVYTGAMTNTAYGCTTDTRVVDVYIPVTKFSSALRAIIAIKKVAVNEISKQIGVHESAVRHWCYGRRFPRKETLTKLCEVLEIDENIAKMLIWNEKQENKDEQA